MKNSIRRAVVTVWLLSCTGCAGTAPAPATPVPPAIALQTTPIVTATGAPPATMTISAPTTIATLALAVSPLATPMAGPTALATVALGVSPLATPALGEGDVVWHLAQWQQASGDTVSVAAPQRYRVQFQAGRGVVSISTDCQSAMGSYTTSGPNISITLSAMTGAMCAPDSPAPAFIAAVASATTYGLSGAELVLHSNAGDSMRFTP